ncbi:MAG: response regulator receiver protein [Pedosphaera sp.]|nr:response regulator receiver protein [Pedosphaera sp.]
MPIAFDRVVLTFLVKTKQLDCHVLVADDLPDDLTLIARALKDMTHFRVTHMARDGEEVIEYLEGRAHYADRQRYPFPQLLILDLKMPRVDGFGVLRWVQAHARRALVVVALTGSNNPEDEELAKGLGADAVFTKPVGLQPIREMVSRIEQFMLTAPKGVNC